MRRVRSISGGLGLTKHSFWLMGGALRACHRVLEIRPRPTYRAFRWPRLSESKFCPRLQVRYTAEAPPAVLSTSSESGSIQGWTSKRSTETHSPATSETLLTTQAEGPPLL